MCLLSQRWKLPLRQSRFKLCLRPCYFLVMVMRLYVGDLHTVGSGDWVPEFLSQALESLGDVWRPWVWNISYLKRYASSANFPPYPGIKILCKNIRCLMVTPIKAIWPGVENYERSVEHSKNGHRKEENKSRLKFWPNFDLKVYEGWRQKIIIKCEKLKRWI